MERDHADPSSGFENLQGFGQKTLQRIDLPVDCYPQGLKSAGGRVNPERVPRLRDGFPDQFGKFPRVLNAALSPCGHNRARDPSRQLLLAVPVDQVGQVLFRQRIDKLCRRSRQIAIHAHVKRSFSQKTKSPLRVLELQTRDAEIDYDSIDLMDAVLAKNPAYIGKVSLLQNESLSIAAEPFAHSRYRVPIPIHSEHDPVRRAFFQNGPGISSPPDRAVNVNTTRFAIKKFNHRSKHDRNVLTFTWAFIHTKARKSQWFPLSFARFVCPAQPGGHTYF